MFRVDTGTGEVARVTDDDGAYTDLNPGPDGRYLYALRATVDTPPTPVRIDLTTGAEPAALECPGVPVTVPGRLEEVQATADDGHPIRSWLVLPETASESSQAPLLLWVHGGPMSSWNSWSWRWNPHLMAARGYAVLLPDPRCPPDTARISSPARTATGAPGRSPTSWPRPKPSWPARTSTRTGSA